MPLRNHVAEICGKLLLLMKLLMELWNFFCIRKILSYPQFP